MSTMLKHLLVFGFMLLAAAQPGPPDDLPRKCTLVVTNYYVSSSVSKLLHIAGELNASS